MPPAALGFMLLWEVAFCHGDALHCRSSLALVRDSSSRHYSIALSEVSKCHIAGVSKGRLPWGQFLVLRFISKRNRHHRPGVGLDGQLLPRGIDSLNLTNRVLGGDIWIVCLCE